LPHQIKHLYASFRKLRFDRYFNTHAVGGLWFFEIKLSERSGEFHPHLHVLLDSDYIPHSKIVDAWQRITLTSSIVHIEAIDDPRRAAQYVSKYATKPARLADYSLDQMLQIYEALHGKKLCGTWGTLRGISLVEPPAEDRHLWQSLGTWETLRRLQNISPTAAALIAAWQANTPRPDLIRNLPDDIPVCDLIEWYEPEMHDELNSS
jgi:hypothetical protein